MIIPMRCFSCGKPISHLYEEFQERSKKDGIKQALDDLKIERFCCRSQLLGHVDLIDTIAEFKKA